MAIVIGHIISVSSQGAIFFLINSALRMKGYPRTLNWCGRIFIKCHTRNRECRRKCSYIQLVHPFNNEMIWFVILMYQKPFLSLKTSLFQVYGNIEIVEGYSSQTYSGGKQFNLLEEYCPLLISCVQHDDEPKLNCNDWALDWTSKIGLAYYI